MKSAVLEEASVEGVYIKAGPLCDDVCVKDEPLCSEVCKDEPSCSDVCVKDGSYPEAAGARGVSEAAAAARLYADHVVKDELVLGPELVEPRRGLCVATGQTPQIELNGDEEPESNKWSCGHCTYTASDKSLLLDLLTIHTPNGAYKHGQCTSYQKDKLLVHETKDNGEKSYKCGQCSYATTHKSSLQFREQSHTGGKPSKCDQCSYNRRGTGGVCGLGERGGGTRKVRSRGAGGRSAAMHLAGLAEVASPIVYVGLDINGELEIEGQRSGCGRGQGRGHIIARGRRGRGCSGPGVDAAALESTVSPSTRTLKRPLVNEPLEKLEIEVPAVGIPLEPPLHELKQKRRFSPPKESLLDVGNNTSLRLFRRPPPAINVSFSPVKEMQENTRPSTGDPALASASALIESPITTMSLEGDSNPAIAMNGVTIALQPRICPPSRPLRDTETEKIINYGSESDSDDSSDEEDQLPGQSNMSRVERLLMDTPEDDDNQVAIITPEDISAPSEQPTWMSDALYRFDWRPFPIPPIPPEERRAFFDNTDCGPTVTCTDPYNIFLHIWDKNIMETIAVETNKYAQQLVEQMINQNCIRPTSRICEWRDTTPDELYVYFGIILAMGVVFKSRVREYWNQSNDIFSTPGFRVHMPLKRFELLSKCLHFNDNNGMRILSLDPSEAKLYKIAPVISHLNQKFQSMYKLGQNIALDESLLRWKGWLQIKQIAQNKIAAVGIKSYEICESQTGYLWRFDIQSSKAGPKQPNRDPLTAATPALVLNLIQGLENRGHTLWMDNFYNSPILARQLKLNGVDCVGTLRTNRLFVPEELAKCKKNQMVMGQVTGFTSGDVDVMVWRDQNRVATISTYHGNTIDTSDDGKRKPILVRDYNIMMGGVDKKDQILSAYPIERKRTRVWYKKLFRRLINASVLNAYIIHKHPHNHNSNILPHRKFRMELIIQLLTHGNAVPLYSVPTPTSNVFDAFNHFPATNPMLPCGSTRLRRVCVICRKRTISHCAGCDKAICVYTCFRFLHKQK